MFSMIYGFLASAQLTMLIMNKYYMLALSLSSLLLFGCNGINSTGIVIRTDTLYESKQNIPSKTTEVCTNTVNLQERTSIIKQGQYTLLFPKKLLNSSSMRYCSDQIDNNGTAFEIDYVDPGGKGMDGYVNGVIGGVQNNGSWQTGDSSLTGMPILLRDLDDFMIIQWKTSQDNALDDNDKWMASINVIFDAGDADAKPDASERDYDLVIELNSLNFNNSTEDVIEGNKRNYLARNTDGTLRTFNIIVDGKTYRYGVRYKFSYNRGDKDNKVHVKYIPIDKENVPPYLNHSLKAFIDNSKEFIQYANLSDHERALANEKVAIPILYLKSIRAGYEVYKGESTLRNDYFRVVFE